MNKEPHWLNVSFLNFTVKHFICNRAIMGAKVQRQTRAVLYLALVLQSRFPFYKQKLRVLESKPCFHRIHGPNLSKHMLTSRMHSSRMRTTRSLTVSHRIPCMPPFTMHAPFTTHAPHNHACPPQPCMPPSPQPCMPPQEAGMQTGLSEEEEEAPCKKRNL